MPIALVGIASSAPAFRAGADRVAEKLETRIEALREEARHEGVLAAAETVR